MTSSDSSSESSYEESSSSSSEQVQRKKREKRSKASKKSRKDKKKGSSKRKHGKHAKAKKSKKDKKKKDKKLEAEPSWPQEPRETMAVARFRLEGPALGLGTNVAGAEAAGSSSSPAGTGAKVMALRKGRPRRSRPRPGIKDDDLGADWDYWSIAIENCKNDEHRVASPAEARDAGVAITLDDAYDYDVYERILGELTTEYQETVPGSLLKKLSEALVKSQRAWPDVENSFLMEGGGWSALVVPVFDGQGPTKKPLSSESHRDVSEQDAHPYCFAHGTSFGSLPYIMAEGMIRPQNWTELPSLGFFGIACMGWLENEKDSEVLKQLLNNALSIGKGQQDALVLGQVRAIDKHVVLSAGGNQRLQVASRKAGLARGPDAWCMRADVAHIVIEISLSRWACFPLLPETIFFCTSVCLTRFSFASRLSCALMVMLL